ncbi:hypothetical protein OG226_41345 [Streptomyces sp. NBC_01261]|nr:hypothetical protein [Streptomyces sp. NBC_01261]
MDVRLKKHHAGPPAVAAGADVLCIAWDWLRSDGISTVYFIGEFAAYLMSCTLVLATRPTWLEQWFGGLDRMYRRRPVPGSERQSASA